MKRSVSATLLLAICFTFLIVSCAQAPNQRINQQSDKLSVQTNGAKKPVIVIIIDSLMDKPLQKTIRSGQAPALKFLKQNGRYFPKIVSSFPTMSVTIDSTLLTGTYADQHHVPGLVWYSGKEKRMIFYGNGPKEALKINQQQMVLDSIYQLNQVQLNKNVQTIHETLRDAGMDSASVNAIVFRGKTEHTLHMPDWIAKSTHLPEEIKVTGPKWLSYAVLSQLDPKNDQNARAWKKYGLNNQFTAQEMAYLISQNKLPEVTIAYFPENDMTVHRKGIDHLDGIIKADQALQTVFNAFGSWEKAVQSAVWVVMGDSAQSAVYDDRQAAKIDLRPLVNKYRIAKLDQPVQKEDQIVIATNERMAYVYAIDERVQVSELADLLRKEEKLDLIARRENKDIYVTAGKSDKEFSYRPGGRYTDEYGQSWTLEGDPKVADLTITGNRISYGEYPDVLARLYGAMNSHEGRYLVVTVKPGYELITESSPTHIGGGAHGSLHKKDSLVPMIVTGTEKRPRTLRIVDMKDWLMELANNKK